MKPIPMLTCESVPASSRWYQQVLGLASAHGGEEYEMLTSGGQLVLQLHHAGAHGAEAHEHSHLFRPELPRTGNGVALWFETEDLTDIAERVHEARAEVLLDVHVNPLAHHRELWLRDLDGYLVVLSSPYDPNLATT